MPAVRLAENGFLVPEQLGNVLQAEVGNYQGKTNFGKYFARMIPGETYKQPELAATLKRIAVGGVEEF